MPVVSKGNRAVWRIQRPMKFDESVIEFSKQLNVFFGVKVIEYSGSG